MLKIWLRSGLIANFVNVKYFMGTQINYSAFFKAVQTWQKENGNNCSICHGNNLNTQCSACGFWGKVVPEGFKILTSPPKIGDYIV